MRQTQLWERVETLVSPILGGQALSQTGWRLRLRLAVIHRANRPEPKSGSAPGIGVATTCGVRGGAGSIHVKPNGPPAIGSESEKVPSVGANPVKLARAVPTNAT